MTEMPDSSSAVQPSSPPAVEVDRCICRNRLFAELWSEARAEGWSLAALMRETGCGDQCGLCRPYLRRMLATGQTVFHQLLPPDAE
jgi:bacterioferritin-associated ferredoxin